MVKTVHLSPCPCCGGETSIICSYDSDILRAAGESCDLYMYAHGPDELLRKWNRRTPVPTTHNLKIWPTHYNDIIAGKKRFDFRQNDRGFRVGDRLHLTEWDPDTEEYTGRDVLAEITYIQHSHTHPGIPRDHCGLGFELMGEGQT